MIYKIHIILQSQMTLNGHHMVPSTQAFGSRKANSHNNLVGLAPIRNGHANNVSQQHSSHCQGSSTRVECTKPSRCLTASLHMCSRRQRYYPFDVLGYGCILSMFVQTCFFRTAYISHCVRQILCRLGVGTWLPISPRLDASARAVSHPRSS